MNKYMTYAESMAIASARLKKNVAYSKALRKAVEENDQKKIEELWRNHNKK